MALLVLEIPLPGGFGRFPKADNLLRPLRNALASGDAEAFVFTLDADAMLADEGDIE